MSQKISTVARKEVLQALHGRYWNASKKEKTRILDEFVAVASCHRKHAVRLLADANTVLEVSARPTRRRIYDEAVREALIVAWEASDRACGKRLKAALPSLVAAMERHKHLQLDPCVRERLLGVSAATIDRLLKPIRKTAGGVRKRRKGRKKVSPKIPVRTFDGWGEPQPGFLEIDFVAHCGGSLSGAFVHSLVATDVCSGWTEAVPLLAREQSLVVEGLKVIRRQLPVPLRGIDSDNDSAFINETLVDFCADPKIEFTRSRAYKKNDQAWIEQKNGAVVRRFIGYERYSGPVAGQALAHLYGLLRLYVNHFQPSFKLLDKRREGAKVIKHYDKPTTPCDRLLANDSVDAETKSALREQQLTLDPLTLLHHIREAQAALAALACSKEQSAAARESLEQFLSKLPSLWRLGEVRPTHSPPPKRTREWRTRKDPFEGVWSDILQWLQQQPDVDARTLLKRLQALRPGQFSDGQVRTLQRRVREWRALMAKELVYNMLQDTEQPPVTVVGVDR